MQRIAPNNQLPATHFVEVWKGNYGNTNIDILKEISDLRHSIEASAKQKGTICVFLIRENKLPTKHKF